MCSTPAPTAATLPAPSEPSVTGVGVPGARHSHQSRRLSAAVTRSITTSPLPGTGSGSSCNSKRGSLAASTRRAARTPHPPMGERAASSPPALARVSESPVVPAYEYDLGRYSRLVSTSSPDAQAWFDRGLAWSYGFNHEEAVRCFQRAVDADPSCAMAHWGIAYAMGPNYNKDWVAFEPDELIEMVALARAAVERAHSLLDHATPVERAVIEALGARFPAATPPEECSLWSDAYAEAMRNAYAQFGDDPDVATLCAEALIGRTPWQLWNVQTGEPAEGADTREALAVLERGIASSQE